MKQKTFLVIGYEDTVQSYIVPEDKLLQGVLGVLFYDINDLPDGEEEFWRGSIENKDNWTLDGCHFEQGVGEIAHVEIWLITDEFTAP